MTCLLIPALFYIDWERSFRTVYATQKSKKNLLCCTLIVVYTGQSAHTSTQPPAPAQPQVLALAELLGLNEWLLLGHSPSPANCAAAVSVPVFHAAAQITPAAAVVPPVQPATAPVIPVIQVYLSSDAPPLAMSLKRL